jgi:glycosyltransferase involved in cell wall biosynthesis
MRIAVISPLDIRVPPVGYGGTELVVSLLIEGLVQKGHDVTLFASGDSITSAKLRSVCSNFLRGSENNGQILNIVNVLNCLQQSDQFDIVHNHVLLEGMAAGGLASAPMLTTLHGNLDASGQLLFERYTGWYNTISWACKARLPEKEGFAGVVYNAIDVPSYPFNGSQRDPHLLFLSRISREKGTHIAIEVAKRSERRLIIAGNVDTKDEEYFKSAVVPHLDGDQIQYVGEADYERKRELMAAAHCLLAPITWPEPFGLFMIEAMACGTPVVAFGNGAAREVVRHRETGFVVRNVEEMVQAIEELGQIDPLKCRERVEREFSAPRMVNDYLRVYASILPPVSENSIQVDKSSPELT